MPGRAWCRTGHLLPRMAGADLTHRRTQDSTADRSKRAGKGPDTVQAARTSHPWLVLARAAIRGVSPLKGAARKLLSAVSSFVYRCMRTLPACADIDIYGPEASIP